MKDQRDSGASSGRQSEDAGRSAPGRRTAVGTRPTAGKQVGGSGPSPGKRPRFAGLSSAAPVQRAADGDAPEQPASDAAGPASGSGQGLAAPVMDTMSAAFDADLSTVRVRESAEAESIGARAFTRGEDIVFAPGQYVPGTQTGDELIGHEVTHVLQQRAGRVDADQPKGWLASDEALEREADTLGARAARGESAEVPGGNGTAGAGAVQRKVVQRDGDDQVELMLTAIRGFARATSPRLHELLHRSALNPLRHLGGDGEIREAMSSYFGRVRGTIAGSSAFDFLLDQAREILAETYHLDHGGRPLDSDIRANTPAELAQELARWITVRGHQRPAAPEPDAAADAPATPAASGDGDSHPGEEERRAAERAELARTLDDLVTTAVRQLEEEFAEMISEDSDILDILSGFRGQVSRALRDQEEGQAGTTLSEQLGVLRRRYAHDVHRSLETDIRTHMIDLVSDERERALGLIGVGGGGGPVVRRADGDPADTGSAADDTSREKASELAARIEAAGDAETPAASDYDEVRGAHYQLRQQLQRGGMSETDARDRIDEILRQVAGMTRAGLIRHAAGDRPDVLAGLLRACGLPSDAVAQPQVDPAADRTAIIAELRGRIDPLHQALERMIAAEGRGKRAMVNAVDRAFDRLAGAARHGGLSAGDARAAVEFAYHDETGHQLRDQLRLAVRGDDADTEGTARNLVERRIGYAPLVAAESGDGDVLDAVYGRLARRMFAEVGELRGAWMSQMIQAGDIDGIWDQVHSEGRASGETEFAERVRRFEAAYRQVNGVPFRAQLRNACEGNQDRLDNLGQRLGIELGQVASSDDSASAEAPASPQAATDQLDVALQELHDVLAESVVEDRQLVDALRAVRGAASAAGLTREAWRARYTQRYHTGLESPVRSRVSDPELRGEALRIIGASEDVVGEMVDQAVADPETTTEQRGAVQDLAVLARTIARQMFANQGNAEQLNSLARVYATYYGEHREEIGASVPDMAAARAMLERCYTALGGDLQAHLYQHGGAIREAAIALEWRGIEAEMGRRELADAGEALPEDVDRHAQRYLVYTRPRLTQLFEAIEAVREFTQIRSEAPGDEGRLARARNRLVGPVDEAWSHVLAYGHEEPARAQRRELTFTAYQRSYGVAVQQHIENVTREMPLIRAALAARLGLTLEGNLVERDTGGLREGVAEDMAGLDESEGTRDAEGELLDDTAVLNIANGLHTAIAARDHTRINSLMQGTRGGRGRTDAERQAITQVHDRLFPNEPLRFMVQRQFGGNPGELMRVRSACGIIGQLDRRGAAMALAAEGDFAGVRTQLLQASDAERETLRQDGQLMATFRSHFDDEQYGRLREVLRGNEGIDDVVREHSSFLLGADQDDVDADLAEMARAQWRVYQRQVDQAAEAAGERLEGGERNRRIRVHMHAWAAERGADADAIDAMTAELDGEVEHTAMRLDSSGQSQLGAVERIMQDPTGDGLLGDLEGLDDAERQRLLADPEFRRRLAGNDGRTYAAAMAILSGSSVEQVAAAAERGDVGGIMIGSSEMSPEEMRVYLATHGEDELSDESFDYALTDRARDAEMRQEMGAIVGDEDTASQRRQQLIFQHKWAVVGEARRTHNGGYGAMLQKAHDAYRESDEAFDAEARAECAEQTNTHLGQILNLVSRGGQAQRLAIRLIRHEAGAETRLEEWAHEYGDDTDTIEHTLENASPEHVARHWSNIRKPGLSGEMFYPVVRRWLDAGTQQGPAWREFRQFRLDVSEDLREILSDGDTTGEADMLSRINMVRGQIRDLPGPVIYQAMRDHVPRMTEEQIAALNDEDRQARLQQREDMDNYHLDMDEGWLARPFTTTDEREDTTALALSQEYNRGISDGELDQDDIDRLDPLRGDFNAARTAYGDARAEVSHWAQLIGNAIVTAVATAFTGPGGPALGATLMTAMAQAATTAAIEEAVNGRNYEFVRTGLRNVLKDGIVAGFTYGAGAWMREARSVFAPAGSFADRALLWREAIREAQPMHWALADAFLTGVTAPATQLRDDYLERMGSEIWSRSSNDGVHTGLGDFEARLDGAMQRQFVMAAVQRLYDRGVGHMPWERVRGFLESGAGAPLGEALSGEAADLALGQDETDTTRRGLARSMAEGAIGDLGDAAGEHVQALQRPDVAGYMASDAWRRIRAENPLPEWIPGSHHHEAYRSALAGLGSLDDEGQVMWALAQRNHALDEAYARSGAADMPERERGRYLQWVFSPGGSAVDRLTLGDRAGIRSRQGGDEDNIPLEEYMASPSWLRVRWTHPLPDWIENHAAREQLYLTTLNELGSYSDDARVAQALQTRSAELQQALARSGATELGEAERGRFLAWVFAAGDGWEDRLGQGVEVYREHVASAPPAPAHPVPLEEQGPQLAEHHREERMAAGDYAGAVAMIPHSVDDEAEAEAPAAADPAIARRLAELEARRDRQDAEEERERLLDAGDYAGSIRLVPDSTDPDGPRTVRPPRDIEAETDEAHDVGNYAEAVALAGGHPGESGRPREQVEAAYDDAVASRDFERAISLARELPHDGPVGSRSGRTLGHQARAQLLMRRITEATQANDHGTVATLTGHLERVLDSLDDARARQQLGPAAGSMLVQLEDLHPDQRTRIMHVLMRRGVRPQVSLRDFLERPVTDAEREQARALGQAEDAMTLAQQAASFTAPGATARDEREMLVAVEQGDLPRFIARVGGLDGFQRHGTFARPDRPFAFATEPADLRGLSAAEAMLAVGWTRDQIAGMVGQRVAVCIFDTHVPVAASGGAAPATVQQGGIEWDELESVALGDSDFVSAARHAGIPPARLPALFERVRQAPVRGRIPASDDDERVQCETLRHLLEQHFTASSLYSGMGATMQDTGDLGAREVQVSPNGTGLRLTPGNHSIVDLGVMTQAMFDALP